MLSSLALTGKKIFEGEQAEQVSKKTRSSEADVISWSGCRDDQTSSDTTENGEATGEQCRGFLVGASREGVMADDSLTSLSGRGHESRLCQRFDESFRSDLSVGVAMKGSLLYWRADY